MSKRMHSFSLFTLFLFSNFTGLSTRYYHISNKAIFRVFHWLAKHARTAVASGKPRLSEYSSFQAKLCVANFVSCNLISSVQFWWTAYGEGSGFCSITEFWIAWSWALFTRKTVWLFDHFLVRLLCKCQERIAQFSASINKLTQSKVLWSDFSS